MAAGLLLKVVGFCVWALFWLGGTATVSTTALAGGDAVVVDARSAVAATDDDFVCATLDWWPPDKCDYGTCAWGRAGLLNLVSREPDAERPPRHLSSSLHSCPELLMVRGRREVLPRRLFPSSPAGSLQQGLAQCRQR